MSQISDDCFAFGGPLMTAAEATRRIAERVPAVTPGQIMTPGDAAGHVLAEDVSAISASPPADNAAVDGYAFRFADSAADGDTVLPVAGRAAAGHPFAAALTPGTAVRIFTGAIVPEGADTVVMQEDVAVDATGHVTIPHGLKPGANRRRAGEDIAAGAKLLGQGRRLGPAEIALLAAGGLTQVRVHVRPRVTIFSTGDEILRRGGAPAVGQVHDANGPMLLALLSRIGIAAVDGGVLPDDPVVVRQALADAARHSDLILTSGGASTGDEDHVRTVVSDLGAIHLWRLAVKPGRPLAFGHVAGRALVGLPGNPVAVMACFLMFVRPLLDRLEGAVPQPLRRWPVRAGFAMTSKPDRREWLRGTLTVDPAAAAGADLVASRYPKQGSGVIRSLTDSDGLIEIAEDVTQVAPGDRLSFISFREALS
ncbi:MAG: molybdopterin molybdotransferase MoeA [Minwuia sp.]|nr:molybdopterin molybdotransferase MoeA [Minwuia sp.]